MPWDNVAGGRRRPPGTCKCGSPWRIAAQRPRERSLLPCVHGFHGFLPCCLGDQRCTAPSQESTGRPRCSPPRLISCSCREARASMPMSLAHLCLRPCGEKQCQPWQVQGTSCICSWQRTADPSLQSKDPSLVLGKQELEI